jgi:hypothetical protein
MLLMLLQRCALQDLRAARLGVPLRGDGDATKEGDLDGTEGYGAQDEAHTAGRSWRHGADASRCV